MHIVAYFVLGLLVSGTIQLYVGFPRSVGGMFSLILSTGLISAALGEFVFQIP